MTKILYMTMLWVHGGIEKYMLNIFDNIDRTKYTFDVALPGHFKQQNEDALIERDIKVIHYSVDSIAHQVKEIKRILNEGNYDIVHVMQSYVTLETYSIFAMVAIAERKKHHYKVICHAHGTEDRTKNITPLKKTLRAFYRGLLRKCFSKADMLVGCSQEAGEFLYGKGRNINVLYNGIDIKSFAKEYSDVELLELKNRYKIKDASPRFVTVARMTDQKNPLFLLDVVTHLCKYYPCLKFTWVGDGELRGNIERHIEAKGISDWIQLVGTQNNVAEVLAYNDYFLLPSKLEGAPLVLIEAQAAGLRCFASDNVPKIIDCGGVSFISLVKNAEEWAAEIHRQIECKPSAMIDAELLKRFDINETVKELSDVYSRLAGSKDG